MKKIIFLLVMMCSVLALTACPVGGETHTHELSNWVSDATDHWHTCSGCDELVDKAAHEFGEWTTVTAATCTTKGSKERVCSICEYKETQEVNALGHTPGAAATCTEHQVCTVCNATIVAALGHTGGTATCTEAAVCEVCGESYGEALGHTSAGAADCTQDEVCGVCNEVIKAATGHLYSELIPAKEADCVNAGNVSYYQCSECSKYFDEEKEELTNVIIPAFGTGAFEIKAGNENPNWDLTKDYKADHAEYENRIVKLTGNNNNDNILNFKGADETRYLVGARFLLTNVYDGEKFGKYGIRIADDFGNGFTYFMDVAGDDVASMTNNCPAGYAYFYEDYQNPKGTYDWTTHRVLGASYIPANNQVVSLFVYRDGASYTLILDGHVLTAITPEHLSAETLTQVTICALKVGIEVTEYGLTTDENILDAFVESVFNKGNYFKSPAEHLNNGGYWDISLDTKTSSGVVSLEGHDNADNHLFFNVKSSKDGFMYAGATITLKQFHLLNDKWLKFGIGLVDGDIDNALYFWQDTINDGSGDLSKITGTGFGEVLIDNYAKTKWIGISAPIGFNLETHSVRMELIYDASMVYFFADGVLIAQRQYNAKAEELYIELFNFGIGCDVENYYCTDDKADAKIAETLAKIYTFDSVTLDGVIDDAQLGLANGVKVSAGANTIEYNAKYADGGIYLVVKHTSNALPFQQNPDSGWWCWSNIEFHVNGVQEWVAVGGNVESIDDNYYIYGSGNVKYVASTLTRNDLGQYEFVFEAFILGHPADATLRINWYVWGNGIGNANQDLQPDKPTHKVTVDGLVAA